MVKSRTSLVTNKSFTPVLKQPNKQLQKQPSMQNLVHELQKTILELKTENDDLSQTLVLNKQSVQQLLNENQELKDELTRFKNTLEKEVDKVEDKPFEVAVVEAKPERKASDHPLPEVASQEDKQSSDADDKYDQSQKNSEMKIEVSSSDMREEALGSKKGNQTPNHLYDYSEKSLKVEAIEIRLSSSEGSQSKSTKKASEKSDQIKLLQ